MDDRPGLVLTEIAPEMCSRPAPLALASGG